jgi:cysteinyl-tRNA synthetase
MVGKPAGSGAVEPPAEDFASRFASAMEDDFNTAAALGHTSELLTQANKLLDQPKAVAKDVRRRTLETIHAALGQVSEVLGVFGEDPVAYLQRRRKRLCVRRGIDAVLVEQRIAERVEARRAKDFIRGDALRQELETQGVELMDGPTGTTWRVAED